MPSINFPDSPTVDQEFTSGGRTWIWNGTAWNSKGTIQAPGPANQLSVGTVTTVATTEPADVTITGASPNQTINFEIPIGPQGPPGNLNNLNVDAPITYDLGTSTVGINPEVLVPAAGNAGQILVKNTSTSYDFDWADLSTLDSTATQIHVYAHNLSGEIINKGDVVYISGGDLNYPQITKAKADAESTSASTIGLAETSIAIDGFGYVVTNGRIDGLDTSTATGGDRVWLSGDVAGGFTFGNPPVSPINKVMVGYVTQVGVSNGAIFVKVPKTFELGELDDVEITSAIAGDTIVYNGTTWVNASADLTPTFMMMGA